MKEQDQYLSVIKFPAFVSITLIILSAVYFGFLYHALQEPGLSTSQTLIFGLLLLVLLVLVATWVATLMSTHIRLRARWMRLLSRWMLVHIYYPLAKFLATVTFSSKNILIESYLNFSNETVLTDQREISNSSILATSGSSETVKKRAAKASRTAKASESPPSIRMEVPTIGVFLSE